MVNGRLASGFCTPAFTWAHAVVDARVKRSAVLNVFISALAECWVDRWIPGSVPVASAHSFVVMAFASV
jgi:hypothetical protein